MDQSLLPNIYDFISSTPPFSQLEQLQKDTVATAVVISYHGKGEVLQNEELTGQGLFLIRSGSAEQLDAESGTLLARLGAGDSFGYTQLSKQGQSDYKVVFLENTLLYLVNRKVLTLLTNDNESLDAALNAKEWVRLSSVNESAGQNNSGIPGIRNLCAGEVCLTGFAKVTASTALRETAKQLALTHTELAVVQEEGKIVGVVSGRDILRSCVAGELSADEPTSSIMHGEVITIEAKQPLYEALQTQVMYGVENLPVVKEGRLIGLLTSEQLLSNTGLQALFLTKQIMRAQSVERLSELGAQNREVFSILLEGNLQPHVIQQMMSHLADAYVRRLLGMYEERHGQPPCSYAFMAAGSLARNEVQLLSDQDNALILSRNPLNSAEEKYFAELSSFVCESLDKCGYPLCSGHYMAMNPQWRVSAEKWLEYYSSWIADASQQAILNSMVFLDTRFLWGDEFLVTRLQNHLIGLIRDNHRFVATLCNISTTVQPPLGTFKQFVLTRDGKSNPHLNIKKQAVNLIVEIARMYGLSAGCRSADTYLRLESAVKNKLITEDDCRELSEAYTFLNGMRFKHQLLSLQSGGEPSNNIEPKDLTQFERNHLRDALRIVARHQNAAKLHFAGGRGLFN
ncbi:MAG: CBS domain-containing protein [Succinivibrio sp.]|nr:CBS domain-containing protein [Succinivibrio sp.]